MTPTHPTQASVGEVRHTPGPWLLATSSSWRRFVSEARGGMQSVCEPVTQPDGHPDLYFRNGGQDGPDARLIAAAPDLLSALQAMLTHMGMDEDEWSKPTFDQARRAIARATSLPNEANHE